MDTKPLFIIKLDIAVITDIEDAAACCFRNIGERIEIKIGALEILASI